jgi:hypothetical protein
VFCRPLVYLAALGPGRRSYDSSISIRLRPSSQTRVSKLRIMRPEYCTDSSQSGDSTSECIRKGRGRSLKDAQKQGGFSCSLVPTKPLSSRGTLLPLHPQQTNSFGVAPLRRCSRLSSVSTLPFFLTSLSAMIRDCLHGKKHSVESNPRSGNPYAMQHT